MKKEVVTSTEHWNPDNDVDLAGILITISAIAKRLAKLLLDSQEKEEQRNE